MLSIRPISQYVEVFHQHVKGPKALHCGPKLGGSILRPKAPQQ